MYNIPLIGAIVVDLHGNPVGIINTIEHSPTGVQVVVDTIDEPEPGNKEDIHVEPDTVVSFLPEVGPPA